MATLYTQAEKNVWRTWLYLTGFVCLVAGLGWVIGYYFENQAIFIGALVISVFASIISYWESDKIVLSMANAKLIEKADNPELYRLVENLCITAGLPLPKIYIIDSSQPNAFATGRNPEHSVIAVTTGLLEKMERVELEGVISHELSHIGNKDILLITIAAVLSGTIATASELFFRFGSRKGKSRDNNRGGGILMVVSLAFMILAPLFAMLMQMAISRKREFLADASGALLTRYPEGLARALEKIAADPGIIENVSSATAGLYIVNPLKKKSVVSNLFSTHPPLEERIAVLRSMKI